MNVLYAEPLPADLRALVEEALPAGFTLEVVRSRAPEEVRRAIAGADFVVVATTRLDAATIAAGRRLRLIQHQGVGYDNIDVAAAARAGIPVALTPEGTSVGVAEHTILLILALYKHLLALDAAVRAGQWPVWEWRTRSFELAGKTLGLVGFGRVGREVARRVRTFDARVVYYDPVRAPAAVEAEFDATYLELDDLLRRADIVSLHLPLNAQTRGLIGARELALMPPHALLINTARGPLVDEPALAEALASRRIAGAGLDVFDQEPPAPDNPLLGLEQVVLTPHVAAGTADAFRAKMRAAFDNMQRVARGEPPRHLVTPG